MLLALISLWESLSAHPGANSRRCWSCCMSHSCFAPPCSQCRGPCSLGIPSPFDPSDSSVSSWPEVWLCTFFPASSLQSPLVFSSETDESIIYRLCWTGTTCLFPSVTFFFFSTTPFSYMSFRSLHADNLIKLYSVFCPISHFKIYSSLLLLQCHVRKQIRFIFISLSYKTVCPNRDLCLF